jgi:hypothetical protein
MDANRFDQVAKSLATTTGRRNVIKVASAGIIAGVSSWLGSGSVDATRCVPYGRRCRRNTPCCSGACQEDGTCGCASNADCDDRSACTLDLCGPTSHQCFHYDLSSSTAPCQECRRDRQCGEGGTCCHGRCCRNGATCTVSEQGLPICCTTCENGASCCDQIAFEEGESGTTFIIHAEGCLGQGQYQGYPSFCCGGAPGGYVEDPDGTIRSHCVSPVGGVF